MEQTKLHSAQLVNVKVSIYPFFLNKKTQMNIGIIRQRNSRKNHTTRLSPLSFFPVSFRYETISGHTPMMLLTTSRRPGRERSPVSMALVETASTASSLDARPPSIAPQSTQSLKKGPKSQRRLMQLFEGNALTVSHRKSGNVQRFSCSHCQGFPCSTQPMCGSLQKEKQVMPRCPPRSRYSPELPAHCLHHHNVGQLWLLLLARTSPPSTS